MGSARESSQVSLHVFSAVKLIYLHPLKLLFTHILVQRRYNIFCQCKIWAGKYCGLWKSRRAWGVPKLIAMCK